MISVDQGIRPQENQGAAAEENRQEKRDTPFVDDVVGNGNLKWEVEVLGDELGGRVEGLHDDGIHCRSHGLYSLGG